MFSRVLPRPSLEAVSRLLTSASLPTSDLTEAHMEHFYYCGPAEQPTGVVGLEFCGEHVLLRSLAVSPERRTVGLGSWLLAFAENEVLDRGIDTVYLLTTTAENFFHRRGYRAVDRQAAPPAIRATKEFSSICPASSAFMLKRLAGGRR